MNRKKPSSDEPLRLAALAFDNPEDCVNEILALQDNLWVGERLWAQEIPVHVYKISLTPTAPTAQAEARIPLPFIHRSPYSHTEDNIMGRRGGPSGSVSDSIPDRTVGKSPTPRSIETRRGAKHPTRDYKR